MFAMKYIFVCLLLSMTTAFAFNLRSIPRNAIFGNAKLSPLRMSEDADINIVPVVKVNIENAAAVTGGILGLVLAGPLGAVIAAALTNYVVKKDNDSGEALRGLGKTVVESYNFLTKLNSKYDLTGKASATVTKAVDSIESESEAVESLKKTTSSTVSKINELNQEYDFVAKGKQLASAAAVLSDTAVEKLDELNAKVLCLRSYSNILFLLKTVFYFIYLNSV